MFWNAHWRDIRALALSPDSSTILSGDVDGNVIQWDAATGEQIRVVRQLTREGLGIYKIAYSPDGTKLGVSWNYGLLEGQLEVYDTATWQLAYVVHDQQINDFAWKPNDNQIALAAVHIRLVNVADGQDISIIRGHNSRTNCLAYTPDGRYLVSGGDFYDPSLILWDAMTFKKVSQIYDSIDEDALPADPLEWSDEVAEGIKDEEAWVTEPFEWLYVSNTDVIVNDMNFVLGRNFLTGQLSRVFKFLPLEYVRAAVSSDGNLLAYPESYDLDEVPPIDPARFRGARWTRGIPVTGANVIVIERQTGQKLNSFGGYQDVVNCLLFSPDATRLYTGDWEGNIRVWELQ